MAASLHAGQDRRETQEARRRLPRALPEGEQTPTLPFPVSGSLVPRLFRLSLVER